MLKYVMMCANIAVIIFVLLGLSMIIITSTEKKNRSKNYPTVNRWSRRIFLMSAHTVNYPEEVLREIIRGMTIVMVPCDEIIFNSGIMKKYEDDPRFDNLILLSYDILTSDEAKDHLMTKMNIDSKYINDYGKHYYTRGMFYYDRFTKTSYWLGTSILYNEHNTIPLTIKEYFYETN